MNDHDRKIKAREKWLKIYEETQSVTKTCLRCGIARSTLYRWIKRYNELGKAGLSDKSKRPLKLANQKINGELEQLILQIRKKHKWGAQGISNYLKRTKRISISTMTIWRVLNKHEVRKIKKRRKKSDYKRYSRPIPGDRVQMDVRKVRPGAYQYTAIDDCTRFKVIRIYPRKTAKNTVDFLGEVLDDFGFPVQRVQTRLGKQSFSMNYFNRNFTSILLSFVQ